MLFLKWKINRVHEIVHFYVHRVHDFVYFCVLMMIVDDKYLNIAAFRVNI